MNRPFGALGSHCTELRWSPCRAARQTGHGLHSGIWLRQGNLPRAQRLRVFVRSVHRVWSFSGEHPQQLSHGHRIIRETAQIPVRPAWYASPAVPGMFLYIYL